MTELLRMGLEEGGERKEYSVRLLQALGRVDPYLTSQKIQELWIEFSQHDSLFSDYTEGKVEPFLDVLFDNRAIVAEVYNVTDDRPAGSMMLNKIIPYFDAQAHFTQWDSNVRHKDPLFHQMMKIWMDQFELHRLSVELPYHQRGVIRLIERLGFKEEGTRREGSIHKGAWIDLAMFGILKTELEDMLQGA